MFIKKIIIFGRYICVVFLAIVFCVINVADAQANISLDKVILNFVPGEKPVQNIMITNQGEKTVKVSGSVVQIQNSGQENEKEFPSKNLILAPKAFELAPGAQRQVRLVLRNFPDQQEGIYRVRFKPDTPQITTQEPKPGMSVKIGVVMTMGALVMVTPTVPSPKLTFERKKDVITFKNEGNVTAQLQREEFCTDGRKNCTSLDGKRIYPGMTWDHAIPESLLGKAFSQTVLINGQYSTLSFPVP